MDFSGLSLIKLRKEEMESQVCGESKFLKCWCGLSCFLLLLSVDANLNGSKGKFLHRLVCHEPFNCRQGDESSIAVAAYSLLLLLPHRSRSWSWRASLRMSACDWVSWGRSITRSPGFLSISCLRAMATSARVPILPLCHPSRANQHSARNQRLHRSPP